MHLQPNGTNGTERDFPFVPVRNGTALVPLRTSENPPKVRFLGADINGRFPVPPPGLTTRLTVEIVKFVTIPTRPEDGQPLHASKPCHVA